MSALLGIFPRSTTLVPRNQGVRLDSMVWRTAASDLSVRTCNMPDSGDSSGELYAKEFG